MALQSNLQKMMTGTTSYKEGFISVPNIGMSNFLSEDAKDEEERDASGNIISPSDTKNAPSKSSATTPGSKKPVSNTQATMSAIQDTNTNNILVFVVHIIFAVVIAYIWGILGSNILFLITRSKKEKEYILPTNRYAPPYCLNNQDNPNYFSYGFPYNLIQRVCTKETLPDVIRTERENIYLINAVESGGVGNGVSQALFNYIFSSVYGGLGQGGRSFAQACLNLFSTTNTSKKDSDHSWDDMQASGGRKFIIFMILPFILSYFIGILGFIAGGAGLVFGIVNEHPFWGIIFTLFFGFFIAFGNFFWMIIQSIYVFCFYPCLNMRNKDEYNKIFNDLRSYMLFVFYVLVILYAFQDLGDSGGAGVLFLIIIAFFTGNS